MSDAIQWVASPTPDTPHRIHAQELGYLMIIDFQYEAWWLSVQQVKHPHGVPPTTYGNLYATLKGAKRAAARFLRKHEDGE